MHTAASLAAIAAANARRELAAGGTGGQNGDDEEGAEKAPEDWFFWGLILAAAYSPWSGRAPSEWKYLQSSSGPPKRKRGDGEVTVDGANPVCNPKAMARLNPNGEAFTRRQLDAAVKKEKEAEKRAAKEKENQETKQEALGAMKTANDHASRISQNIEKMVELKEKEASRIAREDKIKALEKKLMLGLGDPVSVKADLLRLLDEC